MCVKKKKRNKETEAMNKKRVFTKTKNKNVLFYTINAKHTIGDIIIYISNDEMISNCAHDDLPKRGMSQLHNKRKRNQCLCVFLIAVLSLKIL